jgi:hypothetical protein
MAMTSENITAGLPNREEMHYLTRGHGQNGQEINATTIRACVEKGLAEPWFANPMKPDWLVCRLTDAGRQLFA